LKYGILGRWDEKADPLRCAVPCGSANAIYGLVITAQEGGSAHHGC
jgi:hypothetical protein